MGGKVLRIPAKHRSMFNRSFPDGKSVMLSVYTIPLFHGKVLTNVYDLSDVVGIMV